MPTQAATWRTWQSVGLVAVLLSACDAGSLPQGAVEETSISMVVVSGDGQSAPAGSELPQPVVVRVTDAAGRAVRNQVVNWRVLDGGGSVYGGVSMTDAYGYARERWTLGEAVGSTQVLEARAVHPSSGEKQAFGRFTATATSADAVAAIEIQPSSLTLQVGDSARLTVTLRDAQGNQITGRAVTFQSSSAAVATVSSGLVHAVGAGNAVITATSEGRSATAQISVVAAPPPAPAPVASVTVTPASTTLQVGGTAQLTVTLRDGSGNVLSNRSVSWTSANPSVATVNSSGVVTAVAAGSAGIRATAEGVTGQATVTVSAPTTPPPGAGSLFRADWSTATGTSTTATRDGGSWNRNFCSNQNGVVDVVPGSNVGWTLTPNVLRTRYLTESDCYMVAKDLDQSGLGVGQDYYVSAYIRNDATANRDQPITLHPFVIWVLGDIQAVLWSNHGTGNANSYMWQMVVDYTSTNGGLWGTADKQWGMDLPTGQWLRFAWHVEFVRVRSTDADVRIWPRVYDINNNLLYDARNLRKTWNRSDPQTLQQWYDAGHTFRFNVLSQSRQIGLGTEGPFGARNTGQAWYYAAVEVRSDTWPGPVR